MAGLDRREFERMMDTVEVLRGHFSRIYGKAERQMIACHRQGDMAGFRRIKALRAQMREDYEAALDLIAERVTSPRELSRTRRVLRGAADEAHGFVVELRRSEMTLDRLARAAGFMSELTSGLTRILT